MLLTVAVIYNLVNYERSAREGLTANYVAIGFDLGFDGDFSWCF